MSFLGLNVNWNEVTELGFQPLPAGSYAAKITKTEVAVNKNKAGKHIKIEFTLLGVKGVKGRKIFDHLNIQHPKEEVVKMGLGRVKQICTAVGLDPDSLTDTSELNGKMVTLKLKVKEDETYGTQNKIVSIEAFDENLLSSNSDDSIPF